MPTFTLLIVEDFKSDRELYRRCLSNNSDYDCYLLEAESVAGGLELCRSQSIDAILLDYQLPDGNGLEFLQALSRQSNGNSPPVVMITGQGDQNIAVQAMKLGAQDYLVKGEIAPEILQLTVQRAISTASVQRQLDRYKDRFRVSIDTMTDCVGLYAAIRDDAGQIIDFRFDYLNPAALKSNRMSGDDMSKSLCEMFPAFRTSGLFAEYCQLVETAQPLIKEDLVYEDVFGGERLVKSYSVHARTLDRDEFMVCWQDTTVQKQIECDLQSSHQRTIEIWESMTDAYVTIARDWRMIYANPAATQIFYQLTNLTSQEFIGRSHWDLFPSLIGTEVEREFRRAQRDRVVVHLDVWFEPTGSWFEAHLYPAKEGLGVYFRDITERKQMEQERIQSAQERDCLRQTEGQRFFNLSIDLLAVANFDGYFTRLNPSWEKVFGFTPAELMAQPYLDFVHPDDLENTLAAARGVSVGEVVISFENRYRCKDGSYRWLLWSAMPYIEGSLFYAIAHDITERKQLELARIAAEQERDRFFNLSVDLLAVGSFDGYFVRLNPAFEQIFGFTNAELMAQPFSDFLHPDDRELTLAGAQSLVDGMSVVSFENRYRCKDGTYRWVSWNAIPYAPSQVWYAIGHDLTDRKQMEAALRESESKFSAIFDQSFELMGLVGLDGVLLEVNQTALDSIEAQKEDIVGQKFWNTPWWHTPELQQQLKDAIDRAGKGELVRYEVQFPHPSGVMLTTDFSLKPVVDETGRVVTIVAEAHNITDRKQNQAELEQRNRELDSFVHIVSHDLKAPLRAVANLSQWIEDDLEGVMSADTQQQMELLRNRVHRMGATIDGLLEYARIDRLEIRSEPAILADLLANVIDSIAPPPTFTIEIPTDLPTLNTKRLLLSQVFANLIGNGIKHHDRLDGKIRISCQELGDLYKLTIADDGPGIAPEHHERVFEIFQSVNPQQRNDSTGIGLAIVKKIIEAEGGTIQLESQIGMGTTFYFTWPKGRLCAESVGAS